MNVQDEYTKKIMELRRRGRIGSSSSSSRKGGIQLDYAPSSQGQKGKMRRYFTAESVVLLGCLTVSLLILPLVLPPLPPPPFLLLLLPILILGLLMFLAFMPSDARHVTTYTYV